jgi:large subunit ribosomal protein L15
MKLNHISDNAGARKSRLRVGRGIGSGVGKTSGRGGKGQTARTGGKVRLGFEGGQTPLYRRLPIRGFNNANFTTTYVTLNVGDLQKFVDAGRLDTSKTVSLESLQASGLVKKSLSGLKILGNGDLKAKLTVEAAAASASASAKISKAGGKITLKPIADQTEKFLPAAAKKRAAAAAK